MKPVRLSMLFAVSLVAIAGCGGGSGGSKGMGGNGGGLGPAVGGSNSGGNGGSTGFGGSGGNDPSDAGAKVLDAASTKGDVQVAAADSGSKGDLASAGGSCPAFSPCGGDLVGTWYWKSECAPTPSTNLPTCVDAVPVVDKSEQKVSYTFGADGSVTFSLSGAFTETIQYSVSCLGGDAGATQTCSTFQQLILQAAQSSADAGTLPGVALEKFACAVDSTRECSCDAVYRYAPSTQTGTYKTANNQIVFKDLGGSDAGLPDAGAGDSLGYCVVGNTLTLGSSMSAGSANGFVITLTR